MIPKLGVSDHHRIEPGVPPGQAHGFTNPGMASMAPLSSPARQVLAIARYGEQNRLVKFHPSKRSASDQNRQCISTNELNIDAKTPVWVIFIRITPNI